MTLIEGVIIGLGVGNLLLAVLAAKQRHEQVKYTRYRVEEAAAKAAKRQAKREEALAKARDKARRKS